MIKRILTVLLVLAVFEGSGQGFEGTVHWSMRMDITDPAMKAQMEEAQKKMSDPAMQGKMKEMEAKMNDPEFKKMMESNPQMKQQMEAQMRMMKGGGMNNMMPRGMVIKVKGDNSISRMEGGMMDGMEILNQKDKPSYRIDRANKRYTKMGDPKNIPGGAASTAEPKITKTSETATIAGYNATKYVVEMTERGQKMTQYLWYTTDIKDFDFKKMADQHRNPNGGQMFYSQIDGVPLKVEVAMPQGNMIMEVTEIKRESIPQADVSIPAGFTEQ